MPPNRPPKVAHTRASKPEVPGVQKIKSAIRQTTRLLAKDKLAADVRVETERRLKALQADLALAEQSRLEKTMATRYHKIKFFERQKAIRKINSTKHQLEDSAIEGKARRKLEKTLFEHRIDLNYVLHFPKTRKYVSLFPSPQSTTEGSDKDAANEATASTSGPSETDKIRDEIRQWVRGAMKKGELDAEPEMTLGKHDAAHPSFDDLVTANDDGEDEDIAEENEPDASPKASSKAKSKSKSKAKKTKGGTSKPPPAAANLTLEGDDFFGSD